LSDRLKNYNVSIGLSHPRAASYPELKRKWTPLSLGYNIDI
jgi:hypothetical protein